MAAMDSHWPVLRCSPSTSQPAKALMAGAALLNMLKVREDSVRIEIISSEYGKALDITAIARPISTYFGVSSNAPVYATPIGTMNIEAASIAHATDCPPGI